MKDAPWGNDAPKLMGSGTAFTISQAKTPQNLEQKTCIEETLKKTLDMYIVRVGSKGCVNGTLSRERLIV